METDSAKVCTLVPKVSLMLGSGSPSLLRHFTEMMVAVVVVVAMVQRVLGGAVCGVAVLCKGKLSVMDTARTEESLYGDQNNESSDVQS